MRLGRRTFASVRKHRNYRLYFLGQAVSFSGTWVQLIAASWLVLELTESPVAVGLLALCQLLPVTVLGLFAGSLVDRLEPRRTAIATESLSMALAGTLAALTLLGVVAVWEVYLLTTLWGVVLVLDNPTRHTLTFQLVGRDELPNAVGLNASLGTAARLVGPAVGGVIIGVAGVGVAFAVNAASFVPVLAALLAMRAGELVPLQRGEVRPRVLAGTREGLAYVRRAPAIRLVLALVLSLCTLSFTFQTVLPVLARQTLESGPEVFGLISACFGAGALAGALASAWRGRASLRWLVVASGTYGVLQLVLAPERSVPVVCVLLLFVGACFAIWVANALSALQLWTPDRLRGRVLGLYFFAVNGGQPVGGVLAGWLSAVGGTALAFAVSGAAAVVSALAAGLTVRARRAGALSASPG